MQGYHQLELLLDDRHQHVDADGDPDLRSDGVLRGAVEALDSQMLLDPLEEQLHLPAALVQRADRQWRERELIGQEHQCLARFGVAIADAAQVAGVVLGDVEAVERDGLVADQSGVAIHRRRVQASCIEIALGASDEEAARLIQRVEPLEVEVAPIHDVEGARLDDEQVQDIDIVQLAIGDVNEGGDRAPKIEQRVQLHCRLGGAKRCPRKHRQAQIDGRGIERIHGIGQFHPEVVARVKRSCFDDEPLSELEVDAPVAQLVGIGQRRTRDGLRNTHVVELARLSKQTDLDIAQALAVGKLREGHDAKLLGATEVSYPVIAAVAIHDAMEGFPRQKVHDLREQRLAEIHAGSGLSKPRTLPQKAISDSSRRHPQSSRKARQYWLSSRYPSS